MGTHNGTNGTGRKHTLGSVGKLGQAVYEMGEQLLAAQGRVRELERELATVQHRHTAELAVVARRHTAELAALGRKHGAELAAAGREYGKLLTSLRSLVPVTEPVKRDDSWDVADTSVEGHVCDDDCRSHGCKSWADSVAVA